MLQDQSLDKIDTMQFLERRLNDFQVFGSVRNTVISFDEFFIIINDENLSDVKIIFRWRSNRQWSFLGGSQFNLSSLNAIYLFVNSINSAREK